MIRGGEFYFFQKYSVLTARCAHDIKRSAESGGAVYPRPNSKLCKLCQCTRTAKSKQTTPIRHVESLAAGAAAGGPSKAAAGAAAAAVGEGFVGEAAPALLGVRVGAARFDRGLFVLGAFLRPTKFSTTTSRPCTTCRGTPALASSCGALAERLRSADRVGAARCSGVRGTSEGLLLEPGSFGADRRWPAPRTPAEACFQGGVLYHQGSRSSTLRG